MCGPVVRWRSGGLRACAGPGAACAFQTGDRALAGSIALFVVAGIFVKPDRHSMLLGMRRENWFHYMIGVASFGMARALALP